MDNMKAHLYVLYTMSGQEEHLMDLLYGSVVEEPAAFFREAGEIIPSSEECLFTPAAEFSKKIEGEEHRDKRKLYPGYIFLNTDRPVDFFTRLRGANFYGTFGKYLKLLHNEGSDYDSQIVPGSAETDFNRKLEEQFGQFVSRISDEEEENVLRLCGLVRNDEGDIVKNRMVPVNEETAELLAKNGVDVYRSPEGGRFLLVPAVTGSVSEDHTATSAQSRTILRGASQEGTTQEKTVQKAPQEETVQKISQEGTTEKKTAQQRTLHQRTMQKKTGQQRASDMFTAEMSHCIKFIRKGAVSGRHQEGDVRYVIIDGPLMGMEGRIVSSNAHKKMAVVRTHLMKREIDIKMPLEIVKVVEV